ncbi:MAG: GH3 auxin-responsive promoter family protein [Eubacterium sp.]|nr:GH3 auxin-responsive promoter family protein [Eubacterium sp.]
MDKPLVSVVTPVYKTELRLLKRATDCLKNQTIGFINIEWNLVIHNSGDEYNRSVRELLAGEFDGKLPDNIRIKTLEDDGRGPSTPRNKGMEMAGAPYIAFLDSDDTFTENCLESVVGYAEKNNSDITVFRRSFEMEREGLARVTEVVRWNQMREEIVLTRDTWEEEKMFVGIWGMVTSRVYRRSFLDKYGIRFSEDIPFGEDYMFNVEAYHRAERICYLPQLIGYRYYINSSSMVQGSEKDADTLVAYARGFEKLFDTAIKYGIYMNPTISRLCALLSKYILGCPDMTPDKHRQISRLLGRFVEMTTLMEPDKIYPEAAVIEGFELPREVILNPEQSEGLDDRDILFSPDRYYSNIDPGRNSLYRILTENADTDIGQFYRFSSIRSISGYRERVPLSDYSDYERLINLQTEIGESNILTSGDIRAYSVSTDPTGALKRFVCTKETIDACVRAVNDRIKGERVLLLADLYFRGKVNNDGIRERSLIEYAFLNTVLPGYSTKDIHGSAVDGIEGIFRDRSRYLQILYGLKKKDLTMILADDTRSIYEFFRFIEENHDSICDDIEVGTVEGETLAELVEDEREFFRDVVVPDPERADELRSIFAQGFTEPVAEKIWSEFRGTSAVGIGSFSIYTDNMRRYVGDKPHRELGYLRSEAFMGNSLADGHFSMDVWNIFIEFLPFADGMEGERPLSVYELIDGHEYKPVITTASGLYRYRMDDVFTCISHENGIPVMSYEFNSKCSIVIKDTYISEKKIYQTIRSMCEKTGIIVDEYAYRQGDEAESIKLYLELHSDDIIPDKYACEKAFEEVFIPGIKVNIFFVEPQTGQLYTDMQTYERGQSSNQIKPVRCLDDPDREEFLRIHLMRHQ